MLSPARPLRVAVLCSRRAPGLLDLLGDPRHGSLYDVVCCLTTEEAFEGQSGVEARAIPCVAHPLRRFYRARGAALWDLGVRREYDAATVERLAPFQPELIALSSYLFILTGPMLAAYLGRIVNVHHADLTLRDASGRPRYPGLRAVRDAILAGEAETRATSHLVTEALDDGPLLLRSWAFPVAPLARDVLAWGARDILHAYAFAHQEWMLRSAWGPLLAGSIELIATRAVVTTGLLRPEATLRPAAGA